MNITSAQIVLPCSDLGSTISYLTARFGFRLDMISPADAPDTAILSGHGLTVRFEQHPGAFSPAKIVLRCNRSNFPSDLPEMLTGPDGLTVVLADEAEVAIPESSDEFVMTRFDSGAGWHAGRAGMLYRDLIPGRLGGRFIASHIRIPEGGPVPDYVHYHKVRFQMIYCRSGWVRVVYEDQGEPFVMNARDCVLQPPGIRHRVLESSPGLEVVEIGCPAIHETWVDHEIVLPNGRLDPERAFGLQKFVRHVAGDAVWENSRLEGFLERDTGIGGATRGLAEVRVLKAASETAASGRHDGEFLFWFVLKGRFKLSAFGEYEMTENDSCVLPSGTDFGIAADSGSELLEVIL